MNDEGAKRRIKSDRARRAFTLREKGTPDPVLEAEVAARPFPIARYLFLCREIEHHQPYGGLTIHHTMDRLIVTGFPVDLSFWLAAAFADGDDEAYRLQAVAVHQNGQAGIIDDRYVDIPAEGSQPFELHITGLATGPGLRFYHVSLDYRRIGTLRLSIEAPPAAPGQGEA